MRDINASLRKAYNTALKNVVGVPVYYQYAPNVENLSAYIVFRPLINLDNSTKGSSDIISTIIVEIHTSADGANAGAIADNLADLIFQAILPSPVVTLLLDVGQILDTRLASDVTQQFVNRNQKTWISRFITFRHNIFIDGVSNPTTVSVNTNLLRFEYTATGGETFIQSSLLINRGIKEVNVDGLGYSKIITSGSPTKKAALYESSIGKISIAQQMEAGEESFILYQ